MVLECQATWKSQLPQSQWSYILEAKPVSFMHVFQEVCRMDCGGLQFGDLIEIQVVGIKSDNLCHPYETRIVGYVDRQE